MKSYLILILVFIFSFGCQSPKTNNSQTTAKKPSPVKSETPEQLDAKIEFEIENLKSGKPRIIGTTNLPEQTELVISITGDSVKYNGEDKAVVDGGKFESGEFSQQDKPLPPGNYFADIVMPIASVQTQEVQQIIGKNGEYLKGSLVERSTTGTTVKIRRQFSIK